MGKSYTIHCVGVPYGRAMSRVELTQEQYRYDKADQAISYWYPQTKVGEKILGSRQISTPTELRDRGRYVKLITCPVCLGDGHNGKYFCPVCNGSGVCTRSSVRHWRPWQVEQMKVDRQEA